jgi:hypothetical protein
MLCAHHFLSAEDLCKWEDLQRLRLKSGNGSRGTRSESVEERSRYRCAMIEVLARLYRTMAYNLAIQIRRPTWQVGRTLAAARNREDTELSAGASPSSLAHIGRLGIVHEQYRGLSASGSSAAEVSVAIAFNSTAAG